MTKLRDCKLVHLINDLSSKWDKSSNDQKISYAVAGAATLALGASVAYWRYIMLLTTLI
jgi:flagellar biosynthesis/type III secretory pathway M-ring protein FliF/YscJ